MPWPAWLLIGSPVKLSVWVVNRLATWTSGLYLWKRHRGRRRVWPWLILLQAASLGVLAVVFRWLAWRSAR